MNAPAQGAFAKENRGRFPLSHANKIME